MTGHFSEIKQQLFKLKFCTSCTLREQIIDLHIEKSCRNCYLPINCKLSEGTIDYGWYRYIKGRLKQSKADTEFNAQTTRRTETG